MPARAIHGVRLNVINLERAAQFYGSLGMIEDIGMRRAEDDAAGSCVLPVNDPCGGDPQRSVSMRWPNDPFMHLTLVASRPESPDSGWPKAPDQRGSTVLTLLVDEVQPELERLSKEGATVRAEAAVTHRLSGPTLSAFVEDPDGNLVELFESAPAPGWDHSRCSVVGARTTFLHLQLNTYDFERLAAFYSGFGFAPDPLSEGRPGIDYRRLIDMTGPNPYIEAFGRPLNNKVTSGVKLFRLPDDHSQMHLEIMGWRPGNLDPPGPEPAFHQLGIMRYCFKTIDHLRALAELKRSGVQVHLENQRGAYGWGDSEWFYFGDPDGNILCFEEWFPAGHWGERE